MPLNMVTSRMATEKMAMIRTFLLCPNLFTLLFLLNCRHFKIIAPFFTQYNLSFVNKGFWHLIHRLKDIALFLKCIYDDGDGLQSGLVAT